jgi:cysteinyl-tRNA synthetase
MYSCGPTVYGPSHIGNFRSFVFADLLHRYLEWSGHEVVWVMNITDVDDRIIRDLAAQGITLPELTGPHVERFLEDLRTLRIGPIDVLPRATEHIDDMVDLVGRLLERGHAYRGDDGSIFFRIASWPGYGRLARVAADAARPGERVAADDYGKDDVRDFALWKAAKPGEPSWPADVGEGRPGWHIECSAMSMRYLGRSFDIHTGGIDLVFPHHENELAQSEAATGEPFVRTWLHCAHLQTGGAKMARREGNIARPDEVYADGYRPRALRYALLATHYRMPLEYTDETLDHATAAVERLSTALAALDRYHEDRDDDETLDRLLDDTRDRFSEALDDDLNIAPALAAAFDLVRESNRRVDDRRLSTGDARRIARSIRDLDRVLAVAEEDAVELPAEAAGLLEDRAGARERRDWSRSDDLRRRLAELGVVVEDTPDGQRWRLEAATRREPVEAGDG